MSCFSDNYRVSSRCGKYLQVFKHLKLLNVTDTAVKVCCFLSSAVSVLRIGIFR